VKVEDVDLEEDKKQVIQDLSEEHSVPVVVVSGWIRRLTSPIHKGGACITTPVTEPFIVLSLRFLQDIPVKSVEHLMLHEIGHKVLYEMDHEEFAEKFALKNFSGTKEEYDAAWSTKIYSLKTSEPLEDVDVGDDFL